MPKLPPTPEVSDIRPPGAWRSLPTSIRHALLLVRADRPIGWWLLLLPGWVALPQAARLSHAPWQSLLTMLVLFWLGAMITRGMGCIINDLWDRDIDVRVARTKTRPLASGAVSPLAAFIILGGLGIAGGAVLLALPPPAIMVALAAIPLVVFYPLAKRVMPLPQLILALTFSWATLCGWAVFLGYPSPSINWLAGGCLYAGFAAWVFGYDTIYAIQDKADDRRLGIGSSALFLGRWLRLGVAVAYGLALLLWGGAGLLMMADIGFGIALVMAGLHLAWQLLRLDANNPMLAGQIFRSNRNLGLLLAVGSVVDCALAY